MMQRERTLPVEDTRKSGKETGTPIDFVLLRTGRTLTELRARLGDDRAAALVEEMELPNNQFKPSRLDDLLIEPDVISGSSRSDPDIELEAPSRLRMASKLVYYGRRLSRITPHDIPREAALIDFAALLLEISGWVAGGVTGNAAYDLAKLAVLRARKRNGNNLSGSALKYDEALALAIWAVVSEFRLQKLSEICEVESGRSSIGGWHFKLTDTDWLYVIELPPGLKSVKDFTVSRELR
jgi:hypothetical protein